jgi:hypothetical protein
MNEISVIGKNSNLYKLLSKEIHQKFTVYCELSHSEVEKASQIVNPIVFSFDPKNEESNRRLIEKVVSKTVGKLIYISSTSSDVYDVVKMYRYPRLKWHIERFIRTVPNYAIVRVGVVGELTDLSCFYGHIKLSTKESILDAIKQSLDRNSGIVYYNAWVYEFKNGPLFKKLIYRILFGVYKTSPLLFYALRPLDFILRKLKFYNYGYTFISNTQI